ncbi:uncharacterized protein LOC132199081 [Neocloeon triangulifer]|uniref:uncharacterized protein LOC132199081 n=1 Tax=Neocloeon triangulifer TaxID=2078957 RepID=UPI00286F1794|nr:uncharacterized protein LOC132199081 [Neocloeon triangulifer]
MELSEDVLTRLQKLPSKKVQDLLILALQEQGWTNIEDVNIAPGSALGDGLMALIYRVRVKGSVKGGERAELSLVVKNTPKNKARREAFSVPMLFANEQSFYEKVIPALTQHLHRNSRPLAVAEFYKSITDGEHDALILEDLKEHGFCMADRRRGLDLAHCKVVLGELAKLHAASFILKKANLEVFEELRPFVKDMFWDEDRKFAFEPFVTSCFEETLRTIKPYFDNDDKNIYLQNYRKLIDRGYEFIANIIRGTALGDQVITHGDCWTNNLLFKYESEQKPADVRFLDYQLPRITTPAADVTYFLFTSPKCQMMSENYDELLKTYHESLASIFKEHAMDPEKIFSREKLYEEMARTAPYGLTMAGIVVPAVCVPPEHTPDMEKVSGETRDHFVQEYARQMQADTPEAREQLALLLKHCVDRGFFKNL